MTKLVFDGQREGEEVKFIFRRHFTTAKAGIIFLIVLIILGLVPLFLWKGDARMFWLFVGFVLIGFIGFLYSYMMWYFSLYIVTNQRIRQITQKGLFKKTVVDLGLDKIQSISYGITSVIGGIIGYGTILIQTGVGDLVISAVGKPAETYEKLQQTVSENVK